MAYNEVNRLRKIIKIQDITLEHKKKGVTQTWIYKHIIYPQFYISRPTYDNYLAINAKARLKELINKSNGNN